MMGVSRTSSVTPPTNFDLAHGYAFSVTLSSLNLGAGAGVRPCGSDPMAPTSRVGSASDLHGDAGSGSGAVGAMTTSCDVAGLSGRWCNGVRPAGSDPGAEMKRTKDFQRFVTSPATPSPK